MAWTLSRISLIGGSYRGLLSGEGEAPALEMWLDGDVIGHMTLVPLGEGSGEWQVDGEISAAVLTAGTWTVSIRAEGDILDTITFIAGLDAPEDLRAEVDALRAEVTLLKAAFRRHITQQD
ncbi:hypothetical protein JANAI62_30480 [Jannaschia pagri]|uniref:Uncharacterized protein n=1 Tax=Jannaschia pagri TaxID=2829797 RepID=A0ABQ4NPT1_9RHOB|nr:MULTISPECIES: hypothetical protein [unclassified Jannaschia]GIT92715.1 hypothetical protein JANAI61_31730 [Jannaschia sp. AI_61]GIT96425.1 hypothetical protein JANAI62_30480 [Jannaschia sp. AI_62]